MISEKEIKTIINEHEPISSQKEKNNQIINTLIDKIKNMYYYKSVNQIYIPSPFTINSDNELELIVAFTNIKDIQLIINELEIVIASISNVQLISRDYKTNLLKVDIDNMTINIKLTNDYILELKRHEIIDEYIKKYSYFSNCIKFLKVNKEEFKLDYLTDYLLTILLMYGLNKYNTENRYLDYLLCFTKALEDFINGITITISDVEDTSKGRKIIDLVSDEVISNQINDINISEVRNYRKKLVKMLEEKSKEILGSAKIVLDVKPIEEDNFLSWSFIIKDSTYSATGGKFENNELNYKNALLRGIFKGLKFILEKDNIYTKNITIINAKKDILTCVEKNLDEADNNSRRKTIVRYINENKLNITFLD